MRSEVHYVKDCNFEEKCELVGSYVYKVDDTSLEAILIKYINSNGYLAPLDIRYTTGNEVSIGYLVLDLYGEDYIENCFIRKEEAIAYFQLIHSN